MSDSVLLLSQDRPAATADPDSAAVTAGSNPQGSSSDTAAMAPASPVAAATTASHLTPQDVAHSGASSAPPQAPIASSSSAADAKAAAADAKAAAAAAKAAAQVAYAASGGALRTKRPPGLVKRSIAMHLGYVGTEFAGLQVNRAGAPGSTVEEVLERAVFSAGLIAESNFGDLKKVKWTRNSRTDKGVHSVASVVGLRVLLPGDERFDSDPEGLEIAAALNARLPPQVRVFSAQRVQKKFNARRFCFDRTYEYFLPAHLLLPPAQPASGATEAVSAAGSTGVNAIDGLKGAPAPAAAAEAAAPSSQLEEAALREALAKLRSALGCFVGTHPFHNYTAKRKMYVETAKDKEARKSAREAAAVVSSDSAAHANEEQMAAKAADAAAAAADAAASDTDGEQGGLGEGAPLSQQQQRRRARAAKVDDEPLEDDDEDDGDAEFGGSAVEEGQEPSLWIQSCRWLYEKSEDKRDHVTVRHFRTITSFTADDPAPLVPGGVTCVRLRVRGMSFMLHQIRHMIGGALAVARGSLPLPLLCASLAGAARVTVPRAPPHTLILADCTFPPFRKAGAEEARVFCWSGDRLQLRTGGRRNLEEFRRQSLDPALNELLSHPDWSRFERCLPRFYWDPEAQEKVIRAHIAWEAARAERARQHEAEAVVAAAAKAAEADAAEAVDAAPEAGAVAAEGAAATTRVHVEGPALGVAAAMTSALEPTAVTSSG